MAFPTLPGFAGRKFETFADKDLALVCVQAWNDFVIDEWCAAEPELFVPMTIAPVWDVDLAVAETTRCLAKGHQGAVLDGGPGEPRATRLSRRLLGTAVRPVPGGRAADLHAHRRSASAGDPRGQVPMVEIAAAFAHAARSCGEHDGQPDPRKFPNIKLVWSEGGIGWITAAIERADRQWDRHQYWTHIENAEVLPSEVAERNMWFCMIEEPVGLKYRHDFTVDHILWESDYPHADTPFPYTQAACKELFEGVPRTR